MKNGSKYALHIFIHTFLVCRILFAYVPWLVLTSTFTITHRICNYFEHPYFGHTYDTDVDVDMVDISWIEYIAPPIEHYSYRKSNGTVIKPHKCSLILRKIVTLL